MIHEYDTAIRRYSRERLGASAEETDNGRSSGPGAPGGLDRPRVSAAGRAPPGILRVLETTWRLWREPLA